jgi:hypothetical protein
VHHPHTTRPVQAGPKASTDSNIEQRLCHAVIVIVCRCSILVVDGFDSCRTNCAFNGPSGYASARLAKRCRCDSTAQELCSRNRDCYSSRNLNRVKNTGDQISQEQPSTHCQTLWSALHNVLMLQLTLAQLDLLLDVTARLVLGELQADFSAQLVGLCGCDDRAVRAGELRLNKDLPLGAHALHGINIDFATLSNCQLVQCAELVCCGRLRKPICQRVPRGHLIVLRPLKAGPLKLWSVECHEQPLKGFDMGREIFVFGSNLAGRHGKGAALHARLKHGAELGVGRGLTGNAYALPTKDENLKVIPLEVIEAFIDEFLAFAEENDDLTFAITRVGCGLAGYDWETQIKPLFNYDLPANCYFLEPPTET